MARSPGQPFKDLLVEAFQDLDVPAPRAMVDDEERTSNPREETRPDRRRPRLRDDTMKDLPSPFSLVDDLAFGDVEVVVPIGEPTRPVDLQSIAASIRAAPASLPVAIGAHTAVYRFTLDGADELEPLEPTHGSSTPAPVPEVLAPAPRAKASARSSRRPRALETPREQTPAPSVDPPSTTSPRARSAGPRPKTTRERAQTFYLEALDALAARRVDDARTLAGQAVALAPKETQYRALYRDLYGAPKSTTRR